VSSPDPRVRRIALSVVAGMAIVFVVILAVGLVLDVGVGIAIAAAAFIAIFLGGGIGFLLAARVVTPENE
jgi:hypothetical protein